jgi:hypothetical protein
VKLNNNSSQENVNNETNRNAARPNVFCIDILLFHQHYRLSLSVQTHAEDEPKTDCRQLRFREEERGKKIQAEKQKRLFVKYRCVPKSLEVFQFSENS